jgi:rod shape-determining protein MreD
MRWVTYCILAYLALGIQVGLGDYVNYRGATPNLVLLAALFIAINAPRDAALLGCFMMGLLHDLLTQQPPGLFALSYGLVGLIAAGTQQAVYRDHPLTHFSMALASGVVVAVLLLLNGWLRPPGPAVTAWVGGVGPTPAAQMSFAEMRLSPATEFTRALYTAVLAPVVLGLLARTKRAFAFQQPRRKLANRF